MIRPRMMKDVQSEQPQGLNEKYLIGLFTQMCAELYERRGNSSWYNTLSQARILRLLIADDHGQAGAGYNAVAQLVADLVSLKIEFTIGDSSLTRQDFLERHVMTLMAEPYTVYDVITLLTNKLGGIHLDPVFARPGKARHELQYKKIEAAFNLQINGIPSLRYHMGEITDIVLDGLAPLHTAAMEYRSKIS